MRRIAHDRRVVSDIARNDSARSDRGIISDRDALENRHMGSNPNILSDRHRERFERTTRRPAIGGALVIVIGNIAEGANHAVRPDSDGFNRIDKTGAINIGAVPDADAGRRGRFATHQQDDVAIQRNPGAQCDSVRLPRRFD